MNDVQNSERAFKTKHIIFRRKIFCRKSDPQTTNHYYGKEVKSWQKLVAFERSWKPIRESFAHLIRQAYSFDMTAIAVQISALQSRNQHEEGSALK